MAFSAELLAAARESTQRERLAQGLSPTVTDAGTLDKAGDILRAAIDRRIREHDDAASTVCVPCWLGPHRQCAGNGCTCDDPVHTEAVAS